LRNEIARLRAAKQQESPPAPLTDTERACRVAGLLAHHQQHPNDPGARVLAILTAARDRCADLV
jgi:hypothetical protein